MRTPQDRYRVSDVTRTSEPGMKNRLQVAGVRGLPSKSGRSPWSARVCGCIFFYRAQLSILNFFFCRVVIEWSNKVYFFFVIEFNTLHIIIRYVSPSSVWRKIQGEPSQQTTTPEGPWSVIEVAARHPTNQPTDNGTGLLQAARVRFSRNANVFA